MITGEDIKNCEDEMRGSLYVHGDKEIAIEKFCDACEDAEYEPKEEAVTNSKYAGYEIEFSGYWTKDGDFFATMMQNIKLDPPVKL